MQNQKGFILPIVIAIVVVAILGAGGYFAYKQYVTPKSENNQQLIGGDKDSHGCLIAAGYSWCEAKQKCLRTWEEPCEADQTGVPSGSWKTYTNDEYGFEIKYPANAIVVPNPDTYNEKDKVRIMLSKQFSDTGSVTIAVDGGKSANECKNSDSLKSKQVQINGISFNMATFQDDAMGGQRGLATNYYAFYNDACYVLEGLVGWHSIQFSHDATDGLKATPQEIAVENNKIEAGKNFVSNVVSTFKFTK